MGVEGKNGSTQGKRLVSTTECAPRSSGPRSANAAPKFAVRNTTDERTEDADAEDDDDGGDVPPLLKYATACVKPGESTSPAENKPKTYFSYREEANKSDDADHGCEAEKTISLQIEKRGNDNNRPIKRQRGPDDNTGIASNKRALFNYN